METITPRQVSAAPDSAQSISVFYRITALWALSEALLGGVLHALHLPGTGLFVGGASVLCISLLAHHCPSRKAILKATVMVIVVKGMLSPHSPPGAYLAVFIQGCLGYLLFPGKNYFKLSCLLLGVLTQLQSALQRLVIMLIMFGTDLYRVAHEFVNYILKKAGFAGGDYVLYIVVSYIGLHILMGVFVGWLAGRLPGMLKEQQHKIDLSSFAYSGNEGFASLPRKRKSAWKRMFPLLTIAICFLLGISVYFNLIVYNTAYSILLRAVIIVALWTWVITPLLRKALKHWSATKRSALASELDQVLQVMPYIYKSAKFCWASTSQFSFLKRLLLFPGRLAAIVI
ncbi:hypothetical protein [Pontibacter pudoricolor]|uniref:hypothetical protein n=1 Tax=Pontibacter pudoricolor TaxID=2694930 RepID=UPI001391853E|nr:hypothetical protein [Pontibacter pudoricolor]